MRWNGTARSIAFAAGAAALAPLCWHLLDIPSRVHAWGAFVGHASAPPSAGGLAWVWIGILVAYTLGIAPGRGRRRRRRALSTAAAIAAAGVATHGLGLTSMGVLAVGAIGLSAARIAWHPNELSLRRLVVEAALCLGSLSFSGWLMHVFAFGPLAFAAGVWGFLLVQSLAFSVAPIARRSDRTCDAFEVAHRRLESLLDAAGS